MIEVAALLLLLGGQGEVEPPLLPIPGMLRPKARPRDDAPDALVGGCSAPVLPRIEGLLPFGPGERLSYEVTILGIRTGKVRLVVEPREQREGAWVFPIRASAKTESLFSVLGSLDGRMVSWLSPVDMLPTRTASRFVTQRFGRPRAVAREDAAFSGDGQVRGRLAYSLEGTTKVRPAKLTSRAALLDVLSVIYSMRAREFVEGTAYCFEIYHRRRLWRVEGEVGGPELVRSPFATRRAMRVEGRLRKVGSKDKPRPVTTWVSRDADRLPLLVRTPDIVGDLEVRLTGFRPGRRLQRR